MTFKEYVEDTFGTDADERVPAYVREYFNGFDETRTYHSLFEECEKLRKEYLLHKDGAWVCGAYGWNLYLNAYQLILPENEIDWKAYLIRTSVMTVVIDLDEERDSLIKNNDAELYRLSQEYYVESGYESITKAQMIEELSNLLDKSKERYSPYRGNNPEYDKAMEENYPKFERILNFLTCDIEECEIVRMNKPNDDVTVWYFVKAWNCFYIIYLSDCN